MYQVLSNFGIPAVTPFSMLHSLLPRFILKKPFSLPQSVFQELAHNQYGNFDDESVPQPSSLTA